MPTPYFYFRPILAADRSWSAFDWRSATPFKAEAGDIVRCFKESNAGPLADLLSLVVPVDPADFELASFVDAFEARQVVFVVPPETLTNAKTLALCKQLRNQGYRIAMQIDDSDLVRKIPLAAFDYLQCSSAFARQALSAIDLIYANDAGFHKIATNVGTYEMFDWVSKNGFDWCDSHFLTARNPLAGKEPDLTRLKLLKLLNLVKQDGNTRDIEEIFREEPKLSYNLLRLVNSVAVGARTRISSFSQAIAILGRRQLQRWLQLLIYANNLADGNAPNPMMQLAAARGRQMELLCTAIDPAPDIPELSDNAFMTGLFSLLDVLINLPMVDILKELPMHAEVENALVSPSRDGVFGQILTAITAGEAGDFSTAESILSGLGINPAVHAKAQVTAYYWASRINIQNDN